MTGWYDYGRLRAFHVQSTDGSPAMKTQANERASGKGGIPSQLTIEALVPYCWSTNVMRRQTINGA